MSTNFKGKLLEFQESLNKKFNEVENNINNLNNLDSLNFNNDNNNINTNTNLGISFPIYDKNFNVNLKIFIPLSTLTHIVSNANYETFYLSPRWLKGFIHYIGEGYSVIDPAQLFSGSKTDKDNETKLVVFKEKESLRYSFLVKDLVLTNENDLICIVKNNLTTELEQLVLNQLEQSNFNQLNQGFEFNYEYFKNNDVIGNFLKNKIKIENKFFSILKSAYPKKEILNNIINATNINNISNFNKQNNINLNHYQKYINIYSNFIENKEKYELEAIKIFCSQKIENINLLNFTNSLYMESNTQQIVVKIEPSILNSYLRYLNI